VLVRQAFDNHTRRDGLCFGFYLLAAALHTLFWPPRRAGDNARHDA
jgi:hypothetical protein